MAGGGFKPIDTGKTPGGAERKSTPLNYDYSKYSNQPIYQQPSQGFQPIRPGIDMTEAEQEIFNNQYGSPVATQDTPASAPYSGYGGSPFTPGGMSYFPSLRKPSPPLQFDYARYANQPIYQGGLSSLPSSNLPMGGGYLNMMYNSPVSNQGYFGMLNNAAPSLQQQWQQQQQPSQGFDAAQYRQQFRQNQQAPASQPIYQGGISSLPSLQQGQQPQQHFVVNLQQQQDALQPTSLPSFSKQPLSNGSGNIPNLFTPFNSNMLTKFF